MKNIKTFENFINESMHGNLFSSNKPNGIWHLSTDKIADFAFYHGYSDKNPLETVDEFDRGDYWSIDAGGEDSELGIYKEDPDDDSFVLVPKSEVTDVWFVSYDEDDRHKPKLIRKSEL